MNILRLLLPFASLIISFSVSAQEKTVIPEVKKEETNSQATDSKKQLNLTYEQQTPYREIIKRYAQIVRDVRMLDMKKKPAPGSVNAK